MSVENMNDGNRLSKQPLIWYTNNTALNFQSNEFVFLNKASNVGFSKLFIRKEENYFRRKPLTVNVNVNHIVTVGTDGIFNV